MRGRKPPTEISTTRTRPRQPKATAERKAAEHLAGKVFALHGGDPAEPAKPEPGATSISTFAAIWGARCD